ADGGGRWERACSFLEEMRSGGVEPNRDSYSAVLRACESCSVEEGAGEAAFDLIQTLLTASSPTHTRTDTGPNHSDDNVNHSDDDVNHSEGTNHSDIANHGGGATRSE
ncbi:unnamed protein product, partial [Laminaria digitata]